MFLFIFFTASLPHFCSGSMLHISFHHRYLCSLFMRSLVKFQVFGYKRIDIYSCKAKLCSFKHIFLIFVFPSLSCAVPYLLLYLLVNVVSIKIKNASFFFMLQIRSVTVIILCMICIMFFSPISNCL